MCWSIHFTFGLVVMLMFFHRVGERLTGEIPNSHQGLNIFILFYYYDIHLHL
uniref:Uncharacterized protein n=1 Tax=Arundo donax TaxID=35708 RepID=A0A0A9CPY3_ARUDO